MLLKIPVKSFILNKIWLVFFTLIFLCLMLVKKEETYTEPKEILSIQYDGIWRNLTIDEKNRLSKLGKILFLEEERPEQKPGEFLILFWKYGSYIENRHLKHYTKETFDPFEDCSVKNCKYSFEDNSLNNADVVIFHLHRMKNKKDLPKRRINKQIWTFLTDESPYNTFLQSKVNLKDFNGIFNWSMTYRMDSDIPVPYGRTRKFKEKITNFEATPEKRRDKLVTILGSNCGGRNHRWKYVKKLKQFIDVDVYGKCGNKTACPGHFKNDCPAIDNYLFYLSFENSDCREYVTEKVFWNAYYKNSIPIIMGYDKNTYKQLLPPNSFLHVDDFAEPKDLADYILYLNKTGEYKRFFTWKDNYEVINEHGYFKSKSYHFCRICEALNFNQKTFKVYDKLEEFWSPSKDCNVRES